MGIITGLAVSPPDICRSSTSRSGSILICHAAIALGTMFGGWRIVKTMGTKITKLQPFGGFCAETSGAITLVGRDALGHPGLHHAHDHGRDRGRRRDEAALRGQVGRRGTDRLGLGADDPARGRDVGDQLLRPAPLLLGARPPRPTFFSASRFERGLSSFSCSRTYRRISPGSVQAYCRRAQPMAFRRKNSFEASAGSIVA